MYQAPFYATRDDGKFTQEFDFISDVAMFINRNLQRKNYPHHWTVCDAGGIKIPYGQILACLP